LQPAIYDIQNALSNYPNIPANQDCVVKINFWVNKLKDMKATESLDSDTAKQLKLDLETSY
jgi:hypothetical protein